MFAMDPGLGVSRALCSVWGTERHPPPHTHTPLQEDMLLRSGQVRSGRTLAAVLGPRQAGGSWAKPHVFGISCGVSTLGQQQPCSAGKPS